MSYKVLTYTHGNLGDIIQTLALTRFLPPSIGVLRDKFTQAPGLAIINGFVSRPTYCGDCLFAGIHVGTGYLRLKKWLRSSKYTVGARDPYSYETIQGWGPRTEMIGCATITLPRYDGPREGTYSVDYDGPGTKLTHNITRTTSLDLQWKRALEYLEIYRRAAQVYTSKLHVALPCLAFGTPVYIDDSKVWRAKRFTLLYQAGIPMREMTQFDMAPYRNKYLKFLSDNGIKWVEHDPIIPS